MSAKVNKEVCIGCGLCSSISSVFQMGDDGLAEAVGTVNADNEAEVNEAKDSCPVQAIEA